MKKNVIAIVAAVALVLLAVPTIAFANGMQQAWTPMGGVPGFAHHEMREACGSDVSAGVSEAMGAVRGEILGRVDGEARDNYAAGQGTCPGYVDADGNGACDNCAADQGACPGYADIDNDGVCDSFGSGAHHGCGDGTANGRGGHHGCMRR